MRRTRGSSSVEFILVLPAIALLLAGNLYLFRTGMAAFRAQHRAETQAWQLGMSNVRGLCGAPLANPLATGAPSGDVAAIVGLGMGTLPEDSMFWLNAGAHTQSVDVAPGMAPVIPPLPDVRFSYMPCAETVGLVDGILGPGFNGLWTKYLTVF